MYYFSRSRQKLWQKGETSGHFQKLHELRLDCDNDTILALIEQTGSACHTGAKSCFFKSHVCWINLPNLFIFPVNSKTRISSTKIFICLP